MAKKKRKKKEHRGLVKHFERDQFLSMMLSYYGDMSAQKFYDCNSEKVIVANEFKKGS